MKNIIVFSIFILLMPFSFAFVDRAGFSWWTFDDFLGPGLNMSIWTNNTGTGQLNVINGHLNITCGAGSPINWGSYCGIFANVSKQYPMNDDVQGLRFRFMFPAGLSYILAQLGGRYAFTTNSNIDWSNQFFIQDNAKVQFRYYIGAETNLVASNIASNTYYWGVYEILANYSVNMSFWQDVGGAPSIFLNSSITSVLMNRSNKYFIVPVYTTAIGIWVDKVEVYQNVSAPPTPTPSIDIQIRNLALAEKTAAEMYTLFKFYPSLNITMNDGGQPLASAVCWMNMSNTTAYFNYSISTNYSFDAAGKQLTVIFNESNVSKYYDIVDYKLCKNNIGGLMQLIINQNPHRNITSAELPVCPSYMTGLQLLYNYSVRVINMTLRCNDCNAANKIVTLIKEPNATKGDHLMYYARKMEFHTETFTERETGYHVYTKYPYMFLSTGAYYFNATCEYNATNYTTSKSYTISNAQIIKAQLIALNGVSFVNGTVLESNPTTNITAGYFNNIADKMNITVTYNNGTFVKTASSSSMTLTNAELNRKDTYNVTFTVIDIEGNSASAKGWFKVNDTIFPVMQWRWPNASMSIYKDSIYTVNISFSDLNLYAYNVTVYFPNGSFFNSTSAVDIGSPYEFLMPVNFSATGNWLVKATIADSHTSDKIDFTAEEGTNYLLFKGKLKIASPNAIKAQAIKNIDRFNFNFKHKDNIKIYDVTSDCYLDIIKNSKYKAHIVDYCNKLWVDFQGDDNDYVIERVDDKHIKVQFFSGKTDAEYDSIGGLNEITESYGVSVNLLPGTPYGTTNFDKMFLFNTDSITTTTTSGVLLYFFLAMLFFGMVLIGLVWKIPIVMLLCSVYGFVFGMMLFAMLSSVVGAIFIIFGVILAIHAVLSL